MECELFPDLREQKTLTLQTVSLDESVVESFKLKVKVIFNANSAGPEKYLSLSYKKYNELLNGQAEQRVNEFLKEKRALVDFKKV